MMPRSLYDLLRRMSASKMEGDGSAFMPDEGRYVIEFQRTEIDGSTYFVPNYALHRPAVRKVLDGRFYEPKTHRFVKEFFARVEGSLVHAGTFFGDMLPSFAKSVDGRVYAFEPVLENFVLAKLCVQANGLENVLLQNCALSERFGNLRINTLQGTNQHAGGASSISSDGRICTAMPIDALGEESIVMIQLDVEGHELPALMGAIKTIGACRPVIAIEDAKDNCKGFLQGLNYEMFSRIPGLRIWGPAENERYRRAVSEST